MSKPSSYQLITDVHKIVNRMEDKLDARITGTEGRLDEVEGKLDRVVGKIGIGVMFVTLLVTGIISLGFDWIKSRFA